jgi:hypothetical protein
MHLGHPLRSVESSARQYSVIAAVVRGIERAVRFNPFAFRQLYIVVGCPLRSVE